MKSFVAIVFLGLVALSYGGLFYTAAPLATPLSVPYNVYHHTYSTGANYQLKLDTSLPGSAYASYPYAAAPTAYGYGVLRTA